MAETVDLIHIRFTSPQKLQTCAVPFFGIESKATVAPTFEAANGVSARPVSTQTLEHFTLINIWKQTHIQYD